MGVSGTLNYAAIGDDRQSTYLSTGAGWGRLRRLGSWRSQLSRISGRSYGVVGAASGGDGGGRGGGYGGGSTREEPFVARAVTAEGKSELNSTGRGGRGFAMHVHISSLYSFGDTRCRNVEVIDGLRDALVGSLFFSHSVEIT